MNSTKRSLCALLAFAMGVLSVSAKAAWPDDQPIRLVVPQAAGGTNDIVARIVATELGKLLKQTIIVDNRPGAAGAIGMQAVVQAKPDGYTLGLASDSIMLLDVTQPKLKWKAKTDLLPVGMISDQPIAIAVSSRSPYKSFAELIQDAKARPGMIAYGTSGAGTVQHVVGEWFSQLSGGKFIHVPYRGGGPASTDLAGGQIPMAVLGMAPMLAQEKTGKVRILAVSTPKRDSDAPNVPTLTELGYPQIAVAQWAGIVSAAGLPPAIANRISTELRKVLALPNVQRQFAEAGVTSRDMDLAQFTAFYNQSIDMWTKLVPSLNLTLE
jgi:tripartite-type tricarboxylate transporter receptor subunit TctC